MSLYETVFRDYKVTECVLGVHVDAETRTIVAVETRRNKGGDIVSILPRFMQYQGANEVEGFDRAFFTSDRADSIYYHAIGYDAWNIELERSTVAHVTTDTLVAVSQGQMWLKDIFVKMEQDLADISKLTEYVNVEMLSEYYQPTHDERLFLRALANAYGATRILNKERV